MAYFVGFLDLLFASRVLFSGVGDDDTGRNSERVCVERLMSARSLSYLLTSSPERIEPE